MIIPLYNIVIIFTTFNDAEEIQFLDCVWFKCLPTCVGLPGAAPAFADKAQHASSSGPAQSLAGPAVPARNKALSGCIPQASS